jgi:outer membrane protein assembly factor BamB
MGLPQLSRLRSNVLVLLAVLIILAITYEYAILRAPSPATVTIGATTGASLINETAQNETDWPTFHKNLSRTGFDPGIASFNSVRPNWRSVTLDGEVYAEPLTVGKNVIIATEGDTVYDLNGETGQLVWSSHLGTPVNGASLPCGDIDPSGITGTPTIDTFREIIYVVAFVQPPMHHELFALDLSTGEVKFHFSIDPPGADPTVQQQRAALALSGDYVYIAYGGLDGDCGTYHGWVVGSNVSGTVTGAGSERLLSYEVPTGWAGGIWGPSGPAIDSSGNIFVATGNSGSTSTFDFGDSVIKLSADLKQLDWFAPTNWSQLNADDTDLGSTGPIILNSNFIFQIGKEGVGYLLDAGKLGGIGGQLFSAQVCSGGAYGGLAFSSPYLIVPCANGIVSLNMNLDSSPSFSVAWRGPSFVAGPPIIAGNAVWTLDVTNGVLYVLNLEDGHALFQSTVGAVTRFNSIGAGDREIFVAANRMVLAYLPGINSQEYSSMNYSALSYPRTLDTAFAISQCCYSDDLSRFRINLA